CAVRRGDGTQMLDHLSSGISVDATDGYGNTALHIAARCGRYEMLTMLLREGANVRAINTFGSTALHFAIQALGVCLARQNADGGASPNVLSEAGRSLYRLVKTLVEKGSDVNAVDKAGETPFHRVVDEFAPHCTVRTSLLELFA